MANTPKWYLSTYSYDMGVETEFFTNQRKYHQAVKNAEYLEEFGSIESIMHGAVVMPPNRKRSKPEKTITA